MYFIQKYQKIQDKFEMIVYEGNHRWSTNISDRKLYDTREAAEADLYEFGGDVDGSVISYNPTARDGDGDGIVQEGTPWERPVGT